MKDLIGSTIGHYEIVEQLGRGGMANVYKAHHAGLRVDRALKIIRPDLAGGKGFEERFKREARAVAALRHPHIVQMHDFGQHEAFYYMVMEFVEGEDLKARIQRDGPIRPFSDAVAIIEQLTSALGYAHAQGVLHRDVKPANIMLAKDGSVILTDFGISKMVGTDETALTAVGSSIGTPSYMAPELATGASEASAAADLYAVGVVLYEMLTARVPFAADTPLAVLHRVLNDPITPPRDFSDDIPETLQAVILKAMAFDPADRFPDADSLIAAARSSLEVGADPAVGGETRPLADGAGTRPLPGGPAAATGVGTVPVEEQLAADAPPLDPTTVKPPPPPPAETVVSAPDPVPAPDAAPVPATTVTPSPTAPGPPESEPAPSVSAAVPAPAAGKNRAAWLAAAAVLLLLLLVGVGALLGWRWLGDRWSTKPEEGLVALLDATEAAPESADPQPAGETREPEARDSGTGVEPTEADSSGDSLDSLATGLASGAVGDAPAKEAEPLPSRVVEDLAMATPPSSAADQAGPLGAVRSPAERGERVSGRRPVAPMRVSERHEGTMRFGRSVAGELDPEETVVYDIELRRPTILYFDIIWASRQSWFTLRDDEGVEVFRQGSDLGPYTIEQPGWYTLSVETDATIPVQYEIEFRAVG